VKYFRHAMFRGLQNVFFQHRAGLLSERTWDGYARLIPMQFENPGDLGSWWSASRLAYDQEFQDTTEELRRGFAAPG
jgi:hypothetical protein